MLHALETSPHSESTIIVLWGDHGWHLGEKNHWRKFTLWERSCRAPMLMVVPGLTRPDGRCLRPVEFLDIYPTLVDLCGLEPNKSLEGVSLRPLLKDPGAAWDRGASTSNGPDHIAIRTGRWRYIRHPDGEELYDHQVDPNEWKNLAGAAQLASVKKELAARLPATTNRRKLRVFDDLPEAEQRKLRGEPRA